MVNAEVVAQYEHIYTEGNDFADFTVRCQLLKCPNCENPFLITEDEVFGTQVLYPHADNRINPNLPTPIKSAYREALVCFKSKAYTATAIMCRKTLEGICVENGATGNNLVVNLKTLKDKGIIESRLYEWADALRISGNEAAHDVNIAVSQENARDILEFTNALLEYIFTFRDKFEQFKQRRSANETNPRTSTDVIEL
jgi:hypothetical protein